MRTFLYQLTAFAGILPLFIALDRTPIPWIDEVLWASTSLFFINGQAVKSSVLDAFLDLFYGPVGTYLGAWWMRLAGVSEWNWRLLSFAGGVSIVVLTALLVRAVGGSQFLAVTAACLVRFSTSMGSSINSGRLDTLSIAFELAALLLLLVAMQQQLLLRGRLYSLLAGGAIPGAALSTPRAFTFCLELVFGAAALFVLGFRKRLLDSFLARSNRLQCCNLALDRTQGMSPIVGLSPELRQ
jgi:4-amino-4-deoxy-L-arabinose transferase-like glycosyltransferase